MCRLAAPLLPLVSEAIWRGLTGGRSVHLADWPTAEELPADDELVAAMDTIRAPGPVEALLAISGPGCPSARRRRRASRPRGVAERITCRARVPG